MIANITMIIRLRNKLGITTETIRIVLFSSIGDFTMISGVIDLLLLSKIDNILYWEEAAMFLLLLDKIDLTTVELLDELESVCTGSKVKVLLSVLIDGDIDGEQGTLARKQSKQYFSHEQI
jgi:hypothetical protein